MAASTRRNEADGAVDPLDFFSHLVWINGRPLLDTIEPYRRTILRNVLYSFKAAAKQMGCTAKEILYTPGGNMT